jgi:hypothetical protein
MPIHRTGPLQLNKARIFHNQLKLKIKFMLKKISIYMAESEKYLKLSGRIRLD